MNNNVIIEDWRTVDFKTPEGQDSFKTRVQQFLSKDNSNGDKGFERIFDIIDFTETQKIGFDVKTVGTGFSFCPDKPGGPPKVYASSIPYICPAFDRYGGSLSWEKEWFDYAEFWNIEATTTAVRDSWYLQRACAFYNMISSSRPDSDISWQNEICESKLITDAKTINFACAEIIDSLSANGYEVNPQTRFVVLTPLHLLPRLSCACPETLNYNIEFVETKWLKSHSLLTPEMDQYFVCLPGRKAKGGYRQGLTLNDCENIISYAETVAAWGRYGGCIGDINQFRRCSIK